LVASSSKNSIHSPNHLEKCSQKSLQEPFLIFLRVGISTDIIIDKAYFKWLCPFSFVLSAENPACMMASPFAEIFLRSNVDKIGTLSAFINQEPHHEKNDSIVRYIDYAFHGILPSALFISH
jgi:hypothetical protein